jgi:hypothetical protein
LEAGLVRGEHLSVDGSFIQANASTASRIPREQLAEAVQVKRTVREYLAEVEQENATEEAVPQQERVSTTDPDATYATKGGPAARPRLGKNDCLRDVAAQSQKSRSSVCGVEEPNRPASCTTTSAEVRSRAVLPGGHRSEPETASSLPHPNTETAATHHRVSKDLARTLYFGTSQRPSDSFLTASFSTATALSTSYSPNALLPG